MRSSKKHWIIIAFIAIVMLPIVLMCFKYKRYLKYAYYYVSPINSLIKSDTLLLIDTDTLRRIDPEYGDWLVHPCVRYIPDGLGGHKWWLAVTPYPEGNNKYEQPILYYGEENETTPPKKWNYYSIVQGMHDIGYNADPNLFYDSSSKLLYIIWKETNTPNTSEDHCNNAIMYRTFDGKQFGDIHKLFDNCSDSIVHLTAPSLIRIKDSIYCFATDFEYNRISGSEMPRGKCGIAVWKNNYTSLDTIDFHYSYKVTPDYIDKFDYWHTEFIRDTVDNMFLSIVTNEEGFDALVGMSKDGFHYKYLKEPLISFKDKHHSRNIYKGSIVVVNNRIYFFYPKRSTKNRSVHICYSSIDKDFLLRLFDDER